MTTASVTTASLSKMPPHKTGHSLPQFGATNATIIQKIKNLFSTQTVPSLASLIGVTVKTARNRLDGERKFDIDDLAALIQSDHGFEVVAAIMANAPRKPAWWNLCAPVMEAAEIRKMQILAQRRVEKILQGAVDADRDLTAAIARAEAFAVQSEELGGHGNHAPRPAARIPNRALASAKTPAKRPYAGREG